MILSNPSSEPNIIPSAVPNPNSTEQPSFTPPVPTQATQPLKVDPSKGLFGQGSLFSQPTSTTIPFSLNPTAISIKTEVVGNVQVKQESKPTGLAGLFANPIKPAIDLPISPPVNIPLNPPVNPLVNPLVNLPVNPPMNSPINLPINPPVKVPSNPPVDPLINPLIDPTKEPKKEQIKLVLNQPAKQVKKEEAEFTLKIPATQSILKPVEVPKQAPPIKLSPRQINNLSILKTIQKSQPLSEQQIEKVMLNYLFYVRDKKKIEEYIRIRKSLDIFKIDSPVKKQLAPFFNKVVEATSYLFKINPIAALDILNIYLNFDLNKKYFTNPQILTKLKFAKVIKEKAPGQYEVSLEEPFAVELFKEFGVILEKQLNTIPLIFERAVELNYTLFVNQAKALQCCENLWDAFNYFLSVTPIQYTSIMKDIVTILILVIRSQKLVLKPDFICMILEALDDCFANSYIDKDVGIELVLTLLKLDVVNSSLKNVYFEDINVFNTRAKQVRNCITDLQSRQFFPLKAIIPQIDLSLNSTNGCINYQSPPYVKNFGADKEDISFAYHSLDWVEIWIKQLRENDRYDGKIPAILVILKRSFQTDSSLFWVNYNSPKYYNIFWVLTEAARLNLFRQLFDVFTILAGNAKHVHSGLVLNLALDVIQKDKIVNFLKDFQEPVRHQQAALACFDFICNLITLSPKISFRIQKEIFGHTEEMKGAIVVWYLLEILNNRNDSAIFLTIFEVINSLFELDDKALLEHIREFQSRYSNHQCLEFLKDRPKIKQNQTLFAALCKHFNLLISSPHTLPVLQQQSLWLEGFKQFEPWRIFNRYSINCVRVLLQKCSLKQESYWNSSLRRIQLTELFSPVTNHKILKQGSPVNEIVDDFLKAVNKEHQANRINLFAQSLAIIQSGMTILQRAKLRDQYQKAARIPILQNILNSFVYGVDTARFLEHGWFGQKKQIHPLLVFLNIFNLTQQDITSIQKETHKNVADMAINILCLIMRINSLEKNDSRTNLLHKLMKDEIEANSNIASSVKDRFIESLGIKLGSKFVTQNLVEFLVYASESQKYLFDEIMSKLKVQLINIFNWGLAKGSLTLKFKIQILILKLIQETKHYRLFLNQLFVNPAFWVAITTQQDISQEFNGKNFDDEVSNLIENGTASYLQYFKQSATRLSLISNASEIMLKMIRNSETANQQVNLLSFFQMFGAHNMEVLFKNSVNFEQKLLAKSADKIRFVPVETLKQVNNFIVNFEMYLEQPNIILQNIVRANTLAYSHLSKVYFLVINPALILPISKQIIQTSKFEQALNAILINIIPFLVQDNINYPIYVLYMFGAAIRILGKNSGFLIDNLLKDVRWLKFRDEEENQAVLFLVKSFTIVGHKNPQVERVVGIAYSNIRTTDEEKLSLVYHQKNTFFTQTLDKLFSESKDIMSFGNSCTYICQQYYQSVTSKTPTNLDTTTLINTICNILDNLGDFVEDIPFYKSSERNKDHLVWCWCLYLAKIINLCDYKEEMRKIHNYIMKRVERIIKELKESQGLSVTRAFKQQIELISEYFASLLTIQEYGAQRYVGTAYRLLDELMLVTVQHKLRPVTHSDKLLSSVITVERTGGLLSVRSVSPDAYGSTRSARYDRWLSEGGSIHRKDSLLSSKRNTPLEVSPAELLDTISNYNIIYYLLCYILRGYSSLNIRSWGISEAEHFEETLNIIFNKTIDFYKTSFGVMSVQDLFNTLNTSFFSKENSKQTGKLSTLREKFTIEALAETAHKIVDLLIKLYALHLRQLQAMTTRQPMHNRLRLYMQNMEKISKTLSQFRPLAQAGKSLKDDFERLEGDDQGFTWTLPKEGQAGFARRRAIDGKNEV